MLSKLKWLILKIIISLPLKLLKDSLKIVERIPSPVNETLGFDVL